VPREVSFDGGRNEIMQVESDSRLKELIISLKNSHNQIRQHLWIMRTFISRSDYDGAEKRALELKMVLDSDFAKEESRMRDLVAGSRFFNDGDYRIS
jgi:hypothetical protein